MARHNGLSKEDAEIIITHLNDYIILTGCANPQLAQKIGTILKKNIYEPVSVFSDGEIRVRVPPNLRRRHVFIVQPTAPPVNDSIMELIFMIDAAKRASAAEIIAVIPYFGYARQDRKEMSRVPISASAVASMIQNAGADRILTVDIHSEQQQGFVKMPWDNLFGSYALIPTIRAKKLKNLVIAAPDKGSVMRATGFARLLNADGIALVYKDRDVALNNKSETFAMIGEVKDKNILLVDDMIDTGGTIVNAANLIKKNGAKSVRVAAVHGVLSGNAIEKIENSAIEEVLLTDTIKLSNKATLNKKFTVVSVAPLLAEAIRRIQTGESISKDLIL